jgi:hypothetical protein
MTQARRLAASPAVLYIVYTPGAEAEAKGYEPWLKAVDNPFFNAIPGIHHYANWKLERELTGAPPYGYFDLLGLEADLERVWFTPDLNQFRAEWVRLWGYGLAKPRTIQANAYLMRPVSRSDRPAIRFARVIGGTGEPPTGVDIAWRVAETIRKHYAAGPDGGPWRVNSDQDNPLGLDWLAMTYGDSVDGLASADAAPGQTVGFVARLLAAPD